MNQIPNEGMINQTPTSRSTAIAHNTFWNLMAKGVDFLGNLIASVLVARILGVEGFGQYSFVVAFATIFSMGMDWSLDNILIREVSRRPKDDSKVFGVILGLKFLILLILIPILIAANQGLAMTKGVHTAIYLAAAGIMVFRVGFTRIAEGVFLARDAMGQKALATILYQVVRLVGVAGVLWAHGGLIILFVILLVADLFQALLVGIWVHFRHLRLSLRLDKQDLRFFFLNPCPWGFPCSVSVCTFSRISLS